MSRQQSPTTEHVNYQQRVPAYRNDPNADLSGPTYGKDSRGRYREEFQQSLAANVAEINHDLRRGAYEGGGQSPRSHHQQYHHQQYQYQHQQGQSPKQGQTQHNLELEKRIAAIGAPTPPTTHHKVPTSNPGQNWQQNRLPPSPLIQRKADSPASERISPTLETFIAKPPMADRGRANSWVSPLSNNDLAVSYNDKPPLQRKTSTTKEVKFAEHPIMPTVPMVPMSNSVPSPSILKDRDNLFQKFLKINTWLSSQITPSLDDVAGIVNRLARYIRLELEAPSQASKKPEGNNAYPIIILLNHAVLISRHLRQIELSMTSNTYRSRTGRQGNQNRKSYHATSAPLPAKDKFEQILVLFLSHLDETLDVFDEAITGLNLFCAKIEIKPQSKADPSNKKAFIYATIEKAKQLDENLRKLEMFVIIKHKQPDYSFVKVWWALQERHDRHQMSDEVYNLKRVELVENIIKSDEIDYDLEDEDDEASDQSDSNKSSFLELLEEVMAWEPDQNRDARTPPNRNHYGRPVRPAVQNTASYSAPSTLTNNNHQQPSSIYTQIMLNAGTNPNRRNQDRDVDQMSNSSRNSYHSGHSLHSNNSLHSNQSHHSHQSNQSNHSHHSREQENRSFSDPTLYVTGTAQSEDGPANRARSLSQFEHVEGFEPTNTHVNSKGMKSYSVRNQPLQLAASAPRMAYPGEVVEIRVKIENRPKKKIFCLRLCIASNDKKELDSSTFEPTGGFPMTPEPWIGMVPLKIPELPPCSVDSPYYLFIQAIVTKDDNLKVTVPLIIKARAGETTPLNARFNQRLDSFQDIPIGNAQAGSANISRSSSGSRIATQVAAILAETDASDDSANEAMPKASTESSSKKNKDKVVEKRDKAAEKQAKAAEKENKKQAAKTKGGSANNSPAASNKNIGQDAKAKKKKCSTSCILS